MSSSYSSSSSSNSSYCAQQQQQEQQQQLWEQQQQIAQQQAEIAQLTSLCDKLQASVDVLAAMHAKGGRGVALQTTSRLDHAFSKAHDSAVWPFTSGQARMEPDSVLPAVALVRPASHP